MFCHIYSSFEHAPTGVAAGILTGLSVAWLGIICAAAVHYGSLSVLLSDCDIAISAPFRTKVIPLSSVASAQINDGYRHSRKLELRNSSGTVLFSIDSMLERFDDLANRVADQIPTQRRAG